MKDDDAITDALKDTTWGRYSVWYDLDDGARARFKLSPDCESNPFTETETNGTLHWPERYASGRPAACDGAAEKLDSRGGPVWWQPPADVRSDPVTRELIRKRVQEYLHEEWSYVGLLCEMGGLPCPHCGERKETRVSLWGIESDSGDYFEEVARGLLADCRNDLGI